MDTHPLISIIIPCFNRAKFIEKALQSALDQDYPNIEIIISDNNSTDGTDAIINKYLPDKRVKYFVNDTNIGMIPNFKIATQLRANGEYIIYICSDDYLCNNKFISDAVGLIKKYPNVLLVAAKNCTLYNGTNQLVNDNTDHVFEKEFMYGIDVFNIFTEWFAPGWGGVLMNRNKLIGTNAFESKAQSLDYEANLKLMLQGNIAFIKKPTYVFRKHSSQASAHMTYEAQINNFDFIDNTYSFAKKLNTGINLEAWRENVFTTYLNGVTRKLVNKKAEIEKIVNYVETNRGIKITIFKKPIVFFKILAYKNYTLFSPLVKLFNPKVYLSIKQEIA